MEVLSLFLNKMVEGGLTSGFTVEGPGGRVLVSHLLFVDDSLIFCRASEVDLGVCVLLFHALKLYLVLTLKINHRKTELVLVGRWI